MNAEYNSIECSILAQGLWLLWLFQLVDYHVDFSQNKGIYAALDDTINAMFQKLHYVL